MKLTLKKLLAACADNSFDDGIRIETELDPIAGPGRPVKPAVYEGGKYQMDRRWLSPDDEEPTEVIVIDNVPSQANRLEEMLRRHRASIGNPEIVLDLSDFSGMPAHLPTQLSSLQFPHRNADAYLRDSMMDGESGEDGREFDKTPVGKAILEATPWNCGALMAWFPQALLYGFWQSHRGKRGVQTKHARAWVSEIIGWCPATTDTRNMGLKGDALNLSVDEKVGFDSDNQSDWNLMEETAKSGSRNAKGESEKLSGIGHGQVPFMKESDASAAAVSFARVTQCATLSFAQLRRVSLGPSRASSEADAATHTNAARALLVALGLHAHVLAFGSGFALRSGAELRPRKSKATWLGSEEDAEIELGGYESTASLLSEALANADSEGVPLEGWKQAPLVLKPKSNLADAIRKTWPGSSER